MVGTERRNEVPGGAIPSREAVKQRGSGLIIALSVLAMLAIMATTFITLMRLDTRVVRNYVDDQRCELLAYGMLNYFKGIFRDDLDRTWGKYENRDTAVGFYSWDGYNPPQPSRHIPGFYEYQSGLPVGDEKMGVPVSNDFWFCPPLESYNGDPANIYFGAPYGVILQSSFGWRSWYGETLGRIARYWDTGGKREYDLWVGCNLNYWDVNEPGKIVAPGWPWPASQRHPDAQAGIDDDGNGDPNPPYNEYGENAALYNYYYDSSPFVIFTENCYYQPCGPITREATLPGGLYWRWSFNVGPTQSSYVNLNAVGNVDATGVSSSGINSYLNNMGGIGLKARLAVDERTSIVPGEHLGRIEWQGFPDCYNDVMYAPAAANLEKVFQAHEYGDGGNGKGPSAKVNRLKARALIRYRWGNGSGIPADGTDRWRVGWRRDGASYYKFPSPENPMGSDRYFGANEVMEHDHSVDHPGTSAVVAALLRASLDQGMSLNQAVRQADQDWRDLRPYVNMWGTDTILRGKIWPTEGRLPWRPGGGTAGDWRHIDILKRVNLNIIGASGSEGLPGEDATLKTRWAAKRALERERLYYMLINSLRYTNVPADDTARKQQVCQLIASLADMVDRDQRETYFQCPEDSSVWALGVEKFPVINELALFLQSANTANYQMFRFRVELYNPAENIPWIPDEDEAYDISDYVLRIGAHDYRLGDAGMKRYTDNPDAEYNPNAFPGMPPYWSMGAYGMFASPADTGPKLTWTRFAHVGWASDWPTGLTKAEIEAPIEISLWKPLSGDASDGNPAGNIPVDGVRVAFINGRKCICVDKTTSIRLVKPYTSGGPGGSSVTYVGVYRRWDPMNAKVFGTPSPPDVKSNVYWAPGYTLSNFPTLGKPNTGYPASAYGYKRGFERNFKIVDGDLPSIGWLGELMMKNAAQAPDGPLTCIHTSAQDPGQNPNSIGATANQLDLKAKFDLFRPFAPAGVYQPAVSQINAINLHVLDMFTVWDPSNDGIDNDGDGAIDDDDTGHQAGDKGGPEIRVFGRVDLNMCSQAALSMVWADSPESTGLCLRRHFGPTEAMCGIPQARCDQRRSQDFYGYGPFETVGDLLRADLPTPFPGLTLAGGYLYYGDFNLWRSGTNKFPESGMAGTSGGEKDEDGDGIFGERDERDMLFTWVANHFTTRANVFQVDLNVEICEPPYYPGRKLPFKVSKTKRSFARKQFLIIMDRSTVLRVNPDGTCDFTGPVQVRMLRSTDDLVIY